jgi:hypothetical protein
MVRTEDRQSFQVDSDPTQYNRRTNFFAGFSDGRSSPISSAESSRLSLSYGVPSSPPPEPRSSSTSSSPRTSLVLSRKSLSSHGENEYEDETDAWGHHVDPEEAEAEIIRHSKILSRRAAVAQYRGPI